jgi:hypothetical protein
MTAQDGAPEVADYSIGRRVAESGDLDIFGVWRPAQAD